MRAKWVVLIVLGLLAFGLSGCSGKQVSAGIRPYYKPPIIPVQIAYDLISKSLQVTIDGEVRTPVGAFGLDGGIEITEAPFNGIRTLIIQAGQKRSYYQIEKGRQYRVKLPSDENGKAEVIYYSLTDNVEIRIPNPTNENVAALHKKLTEQYELRRRERAEAKLREARLKKQIVKAPNLGRIEDNPEDTEADETEYIEYVECECSECESAECECTQCAECEEEYVECE